MSQFCLSVFDMTRIIYLIIYNPLVISLNLEGGVFELMGRSFKQWIAWCKANETNIHVYRHLLRQLLGTIR